MCAALQVLQAKVDVAVAALPSPAFAESDDEAMELPNAEEDFAAEGISKEQFEKVRKRFSARRISTKGVAKELVSTMAQWEVDLNPRWRNG